MLRHHCVTSEVAWPWLALGRIQDGQILEKLSSWPVSKSSEVTLARKRHSGQMLRMSFNRCVANSMLTRRWGLSQQPQQIAILRSICKYARALHQLWHISMIWCKLCAARTFLLERGCWCPIVVWGVSNVMAKELIHVVWRIVDPSTEVSIPGTTET